MKLTAKQSVITPKETATGCLIITGLISGWSGLLKESLSRMFSLYNAYARENAYFIDFRPKEKNPQETEAVQVSLFRAIPSVSYKFKF